MDVVQQSSRREWGWCVPGLELEVKLGWVELPSPETSEQPELPGLSTGTAGKAVPKGTAVTTRSDPVGGKTELAEGKD